MSHCAACGHAAKPGDPLRFYRIERRYPQPAPRLYWLPRYDLLRVHRSHRLSTSWGRS